MKSKLMQQNTRGTCTQHYCVVSVAVPLVVYFCFREQTTASIITPAIIRQISIVPPTTPPTMAPTGTGGAMIGNEWVYI